MTELTGSDNGGSTITSYNIEWDQGLGGAFSELVGFSTNSMLTTYTITGLTSGNDYKFRYRVENLFGYSDYSPEVTLTAKAIPDQVATPSSFVNSGTNVVITWVAPNANGGTISSYTMLIQ